jgi:hypothetical protein
MLAPYLHGKVVPRAVPVFFDQELSLSKPSTIDEAVNNVAYLSHLKSTGQIDRDWGDNLIQDQRVILNALVDEAKLLAANQANADHVIRIEGGLPDLPGTQIIMPSMDPVLESAGAIAPPAPIIRSSGSSEPATPSGADEPSPVAGFSQAATPLGSPTPNPS